MSTALRDIADVHGFCAEHLRLSGLTLSADEREELHAEALCLLYALEARWDGRGRFSGYASRYLPGRIIGAWRKLHREHSYRSDGQGGREWQWGNSPLSLDAPPPESGSDGPLTPLSELVAAPSGAIFPGDDREWADALGRAVASVPSEIRLYARRVAVLTADGFDRDAIGAELAINRGEVQQIQHAIASSINLPFNKEEAA